MSSDDEDPQEVIINVHPRNTHPNISAENAVENVVENENAVEKKQQIILTNIIKKKLKQSNLEDFKF